MVTPQQVIAHIGRLPIGDPAAIRSHAARLRADADAIIAKSRRVMDAVHTTRYEGPAADRWRQTMGECERDAITAAAELMALADRLLGAAGQVEAQQTQWHRDFARVAAQLESAAHLKGH
ncbi:MAG: hypothetical protein QOF77_458 [Solirubrobacteraceae bacterium]|nr:hypothetical protein [Solirubrobacteraceae bacterium]